MNLLKAIRCVFFILLQFVLCFQMKADPALETTDNCCAVKEITCCDSEICSNDCRAICCGYSSSSVGITMCSLEEKSSVEANSSHLILIPIVVSNMNKIEETYSSQIIDYAKYEISPLTSLLSFVQRWNQ